MRGILAILIWGALALPSWADARLSVLVDLLRIDEVTRIMQQEGMSYAQTLNEDMLDGQGGGFWATQVAQIYAQPRMAETVRQGLAQGLTPDQIDTAIAFLKTDIGQTLIELENAARAAMQDEAVETAAKERCGEPLEGDLPHLAVIERFVDQADLIERNVSGALSSNFRFYTGLADGGLTDQSEADILAQVYAQEPDVRSDTETWLCGFLLLAYRTVPVDDVNAYVDFYDTAAGRALNAALFDGYETMYRDISYALGRAVALNAVGDDI
jgi:hypothetical protein